MRVKNFCISHSGHATGNKDFFFAKKPIAKNSRLFNASNLNTTSLYIVHCHRKIF